MDKDKMIEDYFEIMNCFKALIYSLNWIVDTQEGHLDALLSPADDIYKKMDCFYNNYIY